MGDATNTVLIFAGELLKKAEHLLIMGLHPSEIIKGYDLARIKALAELESALSDLGSALDLIFRRQPYPPRNCLPRSRKHLLPQLSHPPSPLNNMVTRTH